jgi:hypothetical protein
MALDSTLSPYIISSFRPHLYLPYTHSRYSAHALSMMFERLFQGWVSSYSDGTVPITDPLGTPWETSCRGCLEEEDDDHVS